MAGWAKAKDRTGMNLPAEKYCPRCELTKPSADFHLSKSESDGLQWACRLCVKGMQKLVDQKKLAYKPFTLLLQQYLTEHDNRKLLRLVQRVYDTAMSESPAAVTAQKLLIERLEGKLKEEVAITADTETSKLISDASELLRKIRTPAEPSELLMLPAEQILVNPDKLAKPN